MVRPLRARVQGLALVASLAAGALVDGSTGGIHGQTVRGLLLEEYTEQPIALASVTLLTVDGDSVASSLSDGQGFFSMEARGPGRYVLLASALGYRTARSDRMDLEREQVQVVQLHLSLRPIPVEGVVVEGVMEDEPIVPELLANGFYDRLESGVGEFLTPAQVRDHPATYSPQLFREMVTVELAPDRGRGTGPWNDRVMLRPIVQGRGEGRICSPHLWIDDVFTELMPGEGLDAAVPKSEIEAIEVHRAPFGVPLRYLRDMDPGRACGAVLIWTNRR